MRILHLDSNHPLLIERLTAFGHINDEDYSSSKAAIESKLHQYDGVVLRSRFRIDREFITAGKKLKFIARVGSGLENIDLEAAQDNGIEVLSAPEGNSNAVGEHAVALLLNLMNHIRRSDMEVRRGLWYREANRGIELEGKTVGIIGYGNTGKAFAKKLSGFDVDVIFNDIIPDLSDEYGSQVSLEELQNRSDVISIHLPLTQLTDGLVNSKFIDACNKAFWLINTARGRNVITEDLVYALRSGKIIGAGLDVLEYEQSSFEDLSDVEHYPEALRYLLKADNVVLTPHIAGWTAESKEKLARIIVDKIQEINLS